jgi:hypothetical protein
MDMATIEIKPKNVVKEVSLRFNVKKLSKLRGKLNDKYKDGSGEPVLTHEQPGPGNEVTTASRTPGVYPKNE